jgi:hypothetical protein
MRRTTVTLALVLALLPACGDDEDTIVGSSSPPRSSDADSPPEAAWAASLAAASEIAERLAEEHSTGGLADRIRERLPRLRPTLQAVHDLLASPVPLPPEDHFRISERLDRQAGWLDGAARQLATVADGTVLASHLGTIRDEVRRDRIRFHECVPVGGVAAAMRGDGELAGQWFDESRIYHGRTDRFSSPAEVDLDAVYARIPEYRTLREEKPDPDGPRYYFLLMAAGNRFRAAVRAAARGDGYDLIGGVGAIRLADREVPRITARVIELLPGS